MVSSAELPSGLHHSNVKCIREDIYVALGAPLGGGDSRFRKCSQGMQQKPFEDPATVADGGVLVGCGAEERTFDAGDGARIPDPHNTLFRNRGVNDHIYSRPTEGCEPYKLRHVPRTGYYLGG
jgi:hypothetical protein